MRDEIFGRMWEADHVRFSADVDKGLAMAKERLLGRVDNLSDRAMHGVMLVLAVIASSVTLVAMSPVVA